MLKYHPYKSDKPDKKYYIITNSGRKIYFGAAGMSDFTKHKDEARKQRYINRLLDLTEPAAASPRFWAGSAGRHAGDGHRTAGGSVDRSGSGSTWSGAPHQQQERRLLAWLGNRQLGWNSGREGELGRAA